MDTYTSEIFGEVPKPGSFEDLLALLQEKTDNLSNTVRMWRGQSDIAWPIHSAAYRRLSLANATPIERDLIFYENDLLKRATHRGYRNFEGIRLNDFDLLARLQHHGAATRLVDATRNALVGVFFCSRENPEKVGGLFGFHSEYLGGYEGEPREEPYDEVIKNIGNYKHPQTWEPPTVSSRVAAQHSQFLFSALSKSERSSLAISPKPMALLTIAISPALKAEAMNVLSSVFDIRLITLFPDLDGFGMANSVTVERWSSYRW